MTVPVNDLVMMGEMVMTDIVIDKHLAQFTVVSPLREKGGMSKVYLGRDPNTSEMAAIKVTTSTAHVDLARRLRAEANLLSKLNHEGIVRLLPLIWSRVDTWQDRLVGTISINDIEYTFFAMEYLSGGSLKEWMDNNSSKVSVAEAAQVGYHLADALSYLHSNQILHLDLKPSNVLFRSNPLRGDLFPVLVDFGIAQHIGQSERKAGSLHYMAPERLTTVVEDPSLGLVSIGETTEPLTFDVPTKSEIITEKADMFSLGVVLYQLLTGTLPFSISEHPEIVIKEVTTGHPVPLSEIDPNLPQALDTLVLHCLSREPGKRPSAREVSENLSGLRENRGFFPTYSCRSFFQRLSRLLPFHTIEDKVSIEEEKEITEVLPLDSGWIIKSLAVGTDAFFVDRGAAALKRRVYGALIGTEKTFSESVIPLLHENVRIGREPALASFTLSDRTVSRLHARISLEPEHTIRIYDEGSTSGTYVNGIPVLVEGTILAHNDVVNFGRSQFVFKSPPFAERFVELRSILDKYRRVNYDCDISLFANRLLDILVSVLGLQRMDEGIAYNHIYCSHIDFMSAIQGIRFDHRVPMIVSYSPTLDHSVLDQVRHVLEQATRNLPRIAFLLIPGECNDSEETSRAQNLVNYYLRAVYAHDVVVLDAEKMLEIATNRKPVAALVSLMLANVDLISVSPYVLTSSTPDNMFFGREHELREVTEHIASVNYILLGGRRIGKTSIIKRLERVRLPVLNTCALYHDCSFTPTQAELVQAVATDKTWFPEAPISQPASFAEIIQALPDDEPLVILLDEADKLIEPDRQTGYPLFNTLRAVANAGRCHFVLSGERSLRTELTNPNSPLYNFAHEVIVGRLDFRAVEELITRPMKQLEIELDDEMEMVQRIWDFTSGHPNVVQRLCQRLIVLLNQRRDRWLTLDDVETVVADPDFLRKDFLNIYWERATALERLCSLVMAADDSARTLTVVHETLARHDIHATLNEVDDALERLVDLRNILQRTPEGYEFAVTAFPEIIAKTARLEDLIVLNRETYQHYGDVEPRSKRGSP